MLEEILSRENMTRSLRRVQSKRGTSGIDGMSVDELQPYLMPRWAYIKAEILEGRYKPRAVKQEINTLQAWDMPTLKACF